MQADFISDGVQNALHIVAQALLVPVMVVLVVLIVYVLYQVGTLIAEHVTEHRHLKASMPDLMDAIDGASMGELPRVLEESGLLARQRTALLTLVAHAKLPLDDLVALARDLAFDEQDLREHVVSRTDFVAKIAPMFGLMGTLIPLGPGILALSSGDTETLSTALLIAFDTTTAGLVVAVIAVFVSKKRLRWYGRYAAQTDAAMTAVLRRIRDGQQAAENMDAPAAADRAALGRMGKGDGDDGRPARRKAAAPSHAAAGSEGGVR